MLSCPKVEFFFHESGFTSAQARKIVNAKTGDSKAEIGMDTTGVAPSERVPGAHAHCKTGENAECGDDRKRRPAGQGDQRSLDEIHSLSTTVYFQLTEGGPRNGAGATARN